MKLNFLCAQIAIVVSYCLICEYLIETVGAGLAGQLVNFADTHCHEQNLCLNMQVPKTFFASVFLWESCWCVVVTIKAFTASRYLAGD